jgi:ATP-dependent Zn protease
VNDRPPPDSNNPNNNGAPNNNSPLSNKNAQRLWLVMGVVVLLLFVLVFGSPSNFQSSNRITLNELATKVSNNNVSAIVVHGGQDVVIEDRAGNTFLYYKERETNLFDSLRTFGVTDEQIGAIAFSEEQGDNTGGFILQVLIAVVPTVLIVWLLWRMMRSVRSGQDQAMSFGRSRARRGCGRGRRSQRGIG